MPDTGRTLGGRYRLLELIGQGGMATIYRARDDQLGRDVGVKVLRAEYLSDAAFVLRFRREAQAAAQLSHPNVVSIFDTGGDAVGPYIVMELVTGGDLAGVLRQRGRLPPTAAARIVQQIADALEAAHARGIVHRDIKPSNVLLTSGGRVKVADFGIAQAFGDGQMTLTQPGMTMGSVHYFSPEQARGEVVTGASDVYSAGLVLFEMLTGMRPFGGDSAAAVAMARLTGQVPSPAMVQPDIPLALDAIVRWALAPDPRARPSATELSMALGRFLADPAGAAGYQAASVPPAPVPPARAAAPSAAARSADWMPRAASLGGLFALVLAGVLVFLIIAWGAPGASPAPSPTDASAAASRTPSLAPAVTPVPVPPLIGLRIEDAQALAERYALQVDVRAQQTTDAEPGTVLEQIPEAGSPAMPGSMVQLTIAAPVATVDVPDLRLRTEQDAVAALRDAGLEPGTRFEVWSGRVPEGRVVRTDPRAGTSVLPGTTVDYAISRGPKPTPTPTLPTPTPAPSLPPRVVVGNYQCQDLASARQLIEGARLRVGEVLADSPDIDDSWLVVGQDPEPGLEVDPGRRIDLFLVDPSSPCP